MGINYFYEHLKPFAAPMNQYHIIFLLHIYSYKRAFIKKRIAVLRRGRVRERQQAIHSLHEMCVKHLMQEHMQHARMSCLF